MGVLVYSSDFVNGEDVTEMREMMVKQDMFDDASCTKVDFIT